MILGALATVAKVLPERHGVLVRFAGLSQTFDTGDEAGPFVRVLARRAHPAGGAEVDLPQVGELGVVLSLDDGHQVWLGSLHWQDTNWIDPTSDLSMHRHTSGVTRQVRKNGDMQLDHPSGLRITIAEAQGALPALERKGEASQPPQGPVDVEIAHPAGWGAHVDPDGAMTMTFPAGGSISVDKDGNLAAHGFAKMLLQEANARFCMEDLLTWAKDHKHTAQGATAITTVPTTQPPASSLSPDTMKGPHA